MILYAPVNMRVSALPPPLHLNGYKWPLFWAQPIRAIHLRIEDCTYAQFFVPLTSPRLIEAQEIHEIGSEETDSSGMW